MLASGACAKKDQEQCLSISAFGSMAGCGLPQVTQQQPELCLLESRMLMEESGCQRNKELGDAAELARLLKQRSCDHSLVNTGNKISLMVLLQPSAALQAPLMNHHTQKPRGANWHQRCSLPLPESSTLKTKFFFFLGAAEALFVCDGRSTMLTAAFLIRISWQRLLNSLLGLFIPQACRRIFRSRIFRKKSPTWHIFFS